MGDDQLAQLRAEVQRLKDIEEIEQLKARYCQLVDTQEWDRWANEVFTDDLHFESDGVALDGRDVVVEMVSRNLSRGRTVHHVHSPVITITGSDTATGVWALQSHVYVPLDGSELAFRGASHYHENYVRTRDGWRITSTVLIRRSADPIPSAAPVQP